MADLKRLTDPVTEASEQGRPLRIRGGDSRAWFGEPGSPDALTPLDTAGYAGIIDYHPAELVIRARAGTPLGTLIDTLAGEGQQLGFEPPVPSAAATLGGAVATGLSGTRRPWAGAVRDHVLGVGLVLHKGDYVEFGGQVMKNVAGYDVSRLVCGAHGMLGVIADVSLKVLPRPEKEASTSLSLDCEAAMARVAELSGRVGPLSGACYLAAERRLQLRFSGSVKAVDSALSLVGGESLPADFWHQLDTGRLPQFEAAAEVWRLSCSPDEPFYGRDFEICDWAFAQRWLFDPSTCPRDDYPGAGHWTRYRGGVGQVFEPLSPAAMALHKRLKTVFDPLGIFNPGRMYPEL